VVTLPTHRHSPYQKGKVYYPTALSSGMVRDTTDDRTRPDYFRDREIDDDKKATGQTGHYDVKTTNPRDAEVSDLLDNADL